MGKVPQQTVIVMTAAAAVTIVMLISTLATVIPQSAYAQQNEVNPPLSSSVDSCAYDQLPASINGRIQCIGEGECYSEQFDGKKVKHCNY